MLVLSGEYSMNSFKQFVTRTSCEVTYLKNLLFSNSYKLTIKYDKLQIVLRENWEPALQWGNCSIPTKKI